MLEKLFLYIFCPKWIIYKSKSEEISHSYYHDGFRLEGTSRRRVITYTIMYSKNRNRYKLEVLGLDDIVGIENQSLWQQLTKEIYTLNHSK